MRLQGHCNIAEVSLLSIELKVCIKSDLMDMIYICVPTDDTTITSASNDIGKLLCEAQQELLNLSEWIRINKLSPNPANTEYMIIGHSRKLDRLDFSFTHNKWNRYQSVLLKRNRLVQLLTRVYRGMNNIEF